MPIDKGIQQCSYVRPDGRRCGSPASGRRRRDDKPRCYHHDLDRYPEPLAITPQLREIADLLADPLFDQYVGELAGRIAIGYDVTEELINTLNMFLGFDLRDRAEKIRKTAGTSEQPALSAAKGPPEQSVGVTG